MGLANRPRGADRAHEGWHDASGLQARTCGRSGHRSRGRGRDAPGRRRRHRDAHRHLAAQRNLASLGAPLSSDDPADCVADKGYHSRAVLRDLDGSPWRSRIAEPQRNGFSRWHGDEEARRAVYNNRVRLRSEVGKQALRKRAEIVERSFAHVLDRGGMRRAWLRGRENIHKRYLIHVAGHNLGLLMRLLIGVGTPKEAAARGWCLILRLPTDAGSADEVLVMVLVATNATPGLIVFTTRFGHHLA